VIAPSLSDGMIRHIGASFHRKCNVTLGGTAFAQP
jgi:hypothetical protein